MAAWNKAPWELTSWDHEQLTHFELWLDDTGVAQALRGHRLPLSVPQLSLAPPKHISLSTFFTNLIWQLFPMAARHASILSEACHTLWPTWRRVWLCVCAPFTGREMAKSLLLYEPEQKRQLVKNPVSLTTFRLPDSDPKPRNNDTNCVCTPQGLKDYAIRAYRRPGTAFSDRSCSVKGTCTSSTLSTQPTSYRRLYHRNVTMWSGHLLNAGSCSGLGTISLGWGIHWFSRTYCWTESIGN